MLFQAAGVAGFPCERLLHVPADGDIGLALNFSGLVHSKEGKKIEPFSSCMYDTNRLQCCSASIVGFLFCSSSLLVKN